MVNPDCWLGQPGLKIIVIDTRYLNDYLDLIIDSRQKGIYQIYILVVMFGLLEIDSW